MAQTKKTNNSYLGNKVDIRINNLPDGDISVLDCYGGQGIIWKLIKEKTNRNIKRVSIDKINYNVGFYLPGDNIDYLNSMDLEKYNVIDLDAYGIPAKQIITLIEKKYSGTVFVTFIQSIMGQMPHRLLMDIGFSKKMIEKIPTLFGKRGWDYFLEWLSKNGINKVTHRSNSRKHYLVFRMGDNTL